MPCSNHLRCPQGPLAPVASICATPANRQTDRQMKGQRKGGTGTGWKAVWWALLTDKSAKLFSLQVKCMLTSWGRPNSRFEFMLPKNLIDNYHNAACLLLRVLIFFILLRKKHYRDRTNDKNIWKHVNLPFEELKKYWFVCPLIIIRMYFSLSYLLVKTLIQYFLFPVGVSKNFV